MQSLVIAGLLVACCCAVAVRGDEGSAPVFPGVNWIRHTPEQEGMDTSKLNDAFKYAGTDGLETICCSVHRNGYLVGDKYWGLDGAYNKTNIIWSVSKAWMATLIGTAERDGKLNTSELMTKYVPQWEQPKTANITMEHIMRHCSGRHYDAAADFVTPQLEADQTAYSIKLAQQYPPGTHDQYNQMAYQTLQQVYEKATGTLIQDAASRELYNPLQFESKTFFQMKSFFVGLPQKHALIYGGVTTSCADLARFGHLWMNQGQWGNHTVFTRAFYEKAMSQPVYPFGPARRYGNWGGGPSVKSEGLGRNIIVFNPTNNIVFTRIGTFATTLFKPGDYINKVIGAIKDPVLRGRAEDWYIAY
jgi:CubicO group peptidase (beta-lactamase class C family)